MTWNIHISEDAEQGLLEDEETTTVTVVHVMYGGRDIEAQLNQAE